jgi:membrane-associated phospholipid phosphatase
MIQIDIAITKFVNSFAGQSHLFDRIVLEILQMNTFKMLPLVTLMVWLWFSNDPQGMRRRFVFNGMAGGFIALVITRVVQNLGPHRPRPALSGEFEFVLPTGGYTNDWSSFPSDTTGLAFAMVLGIWFASRKLGVLALFWAIFIIAFPRLYGGFHYVSDLVAGALIGMASTYAFAHVRAISDPLFDAMMRLAKDRKALFYALAFIVAYQTSTYFGDIRKTGEKALHSIGLK